MTHERDGLLVDPSPESIAWGIRASLPQMDRTRAMGRNGRQLVREFGWDVIARETSQVYAYAASVALDRATQPTAGDRGRGARLLRGIARAFRWRTSVPD